MRRSRVGVLGPNPQTLLGIKLTGEVLIVCMACSKLPAASYGVMACGLALALGMRVKLRFRHRV